jgi:hypothetical protein
MTAFQRYLAPPRYDPDAATRAYAKLPDWFGNHLLLVTSAADRRTVI